MKIPTSKNKQLTINVFEKFAIPNSKKENVTGGCDPITLEDMVIG